MFLHRYMDLLQSITRSVINNLFHSDDIYQMSIYVTRTLQQLVSKQDVVNERLDNVTSMFTHREQTRNTNCAQLVSSFDTVNERMQMLSTNLDKVTSMITQTEQKLDQVLTTTEKDRIQKGSSLKDIENTVYLLKRESCSVSVVLDECHTLSQNIREELDSTRRRHFAQ
jgi:predicted  nucleic acid-binding Zn-ribbon protein